MTSVDDLSAFAKWLKEKYGNEDEQEEEVQVVPVGQEQEVKGNGQAQEEVKEEEPFVCPLPSTLSPLSFRVKPWTSLTAPFNLQEWKEQEGEEGEVPQVPSPPRPDSSTETKGEGKEIQRREREKEEIIFDLKCDQTWPRLGDVENGKEKDKDNSPEQSDKVTNSTGTMQIPPPPHMTLTPPPPSPYRYPPAQGISLEQEAKVPDQNIVPAPPVKEPDNLAEGEARKGIVPVNHFTHCVL